jgi:probable addiction module antidote protein
MGKQELIPFDAADYLQSEDDIALYLSAVLEDGSIQEIAAALGDIARARGMARVASDAGLSRESLYKGLSGERTPTADTLLRVIRALGLKLSVRPA